jgi:hypothetical protein
MYLHIYPAEVFCLPLQQSAILYLVKFIALAASLAEGYSAISSPFLVYYPTRFAPPGF